jgi:hypothetical protein
MSAMATPQTATSQVETTRNAFAYVLVGSGTFREGSNPRAVLTEQIARPDEQQPFVGAVRPR